MTAFYNEIEPYAAAWLRNLIAAGLIAPGVVDERDIRDINPDDLRGFTQCHFFAGVGVWSYAARLAGWGDDRPLWTGSCPCQPFSAAGRGEGFADERHLWPHWHHLIRECRPAVVVGEQVASKDGLGWLDLVHADLEGAGYAFAAVDLGAAGVGAPHIRQRLWFVADADHAGLEGCDPGAVGRECAAAERGYRAGGLGDAVGLRRGQSGLHARGGVATHQPGSKPGRRDAGAAHGLADADGAGREGEWSLRLQRPELHDADGRGSGGGLADALYDGQRQHGRGLGGAPGEGQGGRDQRERLRADPADGGAAGGPGPTNGFWRDPDWLLCRDGKWRPVEPGTFPLVDGASFRLGSGSPFEGQSRTGMLRAYGNAISPWPAAAVIEAFRECRP